MKKTFLTLVAIVATATGLNAQGLTATLQQGNTMTPYYGVDAFVNAYKDAQAGAIITLSAGNFNTVDSITKQVTIIGNGCNNHDGTNRTCINNRYITHGGSSQYTSLIINANNVKIEGVYANDVYLRGVSNTRLSHCYFYCLCGTNTHTGTVIDQCYVGYDYSLTKSVNSTYKNSYIGNFEGANTSANMAYFSNCLILIWYHYRKCDASTTYSSYRPYGIYKNCILGQWYYDYSQSGTNYFNNFKTSLESVNTPSEYYNNVFFIYPYKPVKSGSYWDVKFNDEVASKEMTGIWSESQTIKGNKTSTYNVLMNTSYNGWWNRLKTDIPFTGDDGTVVGPYGGLGFSINPSIPRIIESQIDSNTDANGRLNVKIKVEVNQ